MRNAAVYCFDNQGKKRKINLNKLNIDFPYFFLSYHYSSYAVPQRQNAKHHTPFKWSEIMTFFEVYESSGSEE